jgi:ribonuclease HI
MKPATYSITAQRTQRGGPLGWLFGMDTTEETWGFVVHRCEGDVKTCVSAGSGHATSQEAHAAGGQALERLIANQAEEEALAGDRELALSKVERADNRAFMEEVRRLSREGVFL